MGEKEEEEEIVRGRYEHMEMTWIMTQKRKNTDVGAVAMWCITGSPWWTSSSFGCRRRWNHGEKSEEREYLEDAGPVVPAQSYWEASQMPVQQLCQCIEHCHMPQAQAQALVTSGLKFQNRLAQRIMHCNDKAKDSIDAGNKELQVKQQVDSCVTKCVGDHMNLIPTITKKMKESLSSTQKQKIWPLAFEA